MKRFMTITVHAVDDSGKTRMFEMSNKVSVVTIENNHCSMPLSVDQDGWQYTCIELHELLANAFGTSLKSVTEITVAGSCRLSKLYFQSKRYADIELPEFLRVVNPN
jgi:hypothetical protein